jgi:hypothetical protein
MNIIDCILKIYPDWKGVVWENDYNRIKPHELETRPIPTMKDLEAVWVLVQQDEAEKVKEADAEVLIQAKARELAISELKAEGKLTFDGKIK